MARDVEANLTANDRTGTALASAERHFKQASDRIQRDVDKVNGSLSRLGLNKIDLKADPKQALREIDKTERRLRDLSSKAATVEIKIHTERALGDLARFRKQLGGGFDKEEKGIISGFSDAFSAVASKAVPILAGIAVAATPFIAATLSAAIIGGAGIGGVVGGVLLASKDARVAAAGQQLGANILGSLEQDAAVFVHPVLAAIDKIQAAFTRVEPTIRNIFTNASRFVEPLVDGATRGIEGILRGVDALVANASPVIDVLSEGLAQVGQDFGEFLQQVAGNGDAAAAALKDVFDQVSLILNVTGPLISGLTEVFGLLDRIGAVKWLSTTLLGPLGGLLPLLDDNAEAAKKVADAQPAVSDGFRKIADAAKNNIPVFDQYGQAVITSGAALDTMADKIRDVFNANHSLFDSSTNVEAALDDLTKSIKDNGKTLDVHTQKGRANRTALSNVASALNANYEAFVKVNGEGSAANTVAGKNYDAFIKAATGLGISKEAARRYAAQLGLIPAKKDTKVNANTHDAAARLAALKAKLDALQSKTIRVTVVGGSLAGSVHVSGPGGSGTQLKGFDASSTWEGSDGGRRSRTGGPAEVSVAQTLNVSLDGQPFRAMTAKAISSSEDRQAWRAKVGRR